MKNKTPKTRQQTAQEFGISYSTFKRWLDNNDIVLPSGLIFPAEIWYKKIRVPGGNMFWLFGFTIILGLGACSEGQENNHDKREKPKDEKEYHAPVNDLVFLTKKTGVLEKNIVNGFVQNNSAHTTYSNIHVMVEFYDKDDALITSEQMKLNESVQPQEMQKIKLEVDFPEGVKIYRMKLISADTLPQN